jgi:septum formation protein
MVKLYLASRSPRRKIILSKLTTDFELCEVDLEERQEFNETPAEYVLRISTDKAMAARQKIPDQIPVLSADTEVICDGRILGKPGDLDAALNMLLSLSGRVHEVYTGVTLLAGKPLKIISRNRVWFRALDHEECKDYCRNHLVLDKAGAYGIQDRAAAYIDRLEGSYSGVMGLPLADTRELLARAGII